MEITKDLLQNYAKLIVRTGANVQPGQIVRLDVAVDQHEFGLMIMEECYKAGAKKVNVEWFCNGQDRLDYQYAEEEVLSETLPWEIAKAEQLVEDLPASIYVISDDPDSLAGLDVDKISSVMQKRGAARRKYRDQMDGKYQWALAAVPSVPWAKKCFPDLPEEEAVQKLWDAIFATVRVDGVQDPVAAWKAHTDFLTEKSNWLTDQHFTTMKYKSANGTDFRVGLIPGSHWSGAGCTNPVNGVFYIPNMPTEEIFNTPMAGVCEGTLVATKPLSWNGILIEDFSITFKDGRAVSWKAGKGQDALDKMLNMDETSCMLGECALVPKESPVNQCGFLFYETLFDENACCHFAVGAGFKEVLPDGDDLTVEEAKERGVNHSLIHVDFMVGSEDLSVIGVREDGTEVPVFVNGTWA